MFIQLKKLNKALINKTLLILMELNCNNHYYLNNNIMFKKFKTIIISYFKPIKCGIFKVVGSCVFTSWFRPNNTIKRYIFRILGIKLHKKNLRLASFLGYCGNRFDISVKIVLKNYFYLSNFSIYVNIIFLRK